jgi:hypothetical protein
MEADVVGPFRRGKVHFIDNVKGLLGTFDPDEDILRNAGEHLADWVDSDFKHVLEDWKFHFDDVRLPVLEVLKTRGAALVTAFAGDGDRQLLVNLLSGIRHLRTYFDMHLPWEFMYLGDPEAEVRLDKFFGANAVIGRLPSQSNHRRRVTPSVLVDKGSFAGAPADDPDAVATANPYGYAEDVRLDSASYNTEYAIFTDRGIYPRRLAPVDKEDPHAMIKINAFLRDSMHLAHFNCHADPPKERNTIKGKLYVSDEFELDEARIDAATVYPGAIVVLNCCFGHTLRHGDLDTTAERLWKPHIPAIVATTAAIPDSYATRWARRFYDVLFAGQTVPASIATARQQLLAEPNPDPSALLYAYLGEPTARLSQPLESEP